MSDIYDNNNIFALILRGEAPCTKVFEDEWVLAFNDIAEMAPVHVLVIPKGPYINLSHFLNNATEEEVLGFWNGVAKTADILKISGSGYNLFSFMFCKELMN